MLMLETNNGKTTTGNDARHLQHQSENLIHLYGLSRLVVRRDRHTKGITSSMVRHDLLTKWFDAGLPIIENS